jgi:hypothetical protein
MGIFPSRASKDNGSGGAYFKWWWILDLYSSEK